MLRSLTRLAVVVLVLAGVAVAQDAAKKTETVVEPGSEIAMPVSVSVLDGGATHALSGLALREKTIFKVDVYVCGHYVDKAAAREELADWAGKDAAELAKDDTFRDKILAAGFPRTLRLRLARDIDSEDFNDAFEDSLAPRMKKLLDAGEKGKSSDVAALKGFFSIDELAEETKIDFTWKGTTLTVAMDGKKLGAIDSAALCRALWDVYFGSDPIQPEFPRKLVERFPDLLKGAEKAATEKPGDGE